MNFLSLYFDITGWRDSILSLPKKWLSVSGATDEFGFPEVSTHEKKRFNKRARKKEKNHQTIIINWHWSEQTKLNENDCVWRDLPNNIYNNIKSVTREQSSVVFFVLHLWLVHIYCEISWDNVKKHIIYNIWKGLIKKYICASFSERI